MSRENNVYDKKLKLKAVSMYLNEGYSYKYIIKELGIKSDKQIQNWIKLFKEKGNTAFDHETRGKAQGGKKGRPKKYFNSVEEELKYLRMENEYLKKLNALTKN
jgi:transposase-like protein